MKKIFALLLSAGLILSLLAGCNKPADPGTADTPATGDKVVTIGVFEPSTGENGPGGKQEALGMKYANSLTPTVEIGGETYTVKLVPADNASADDKAASAAQQLINEKASIVLGSYGSSVSLAASDTFKKAGVPVIGVTCTNPQITQGNKHYFRICFIESFQGTILANFAVDKLNAKTVYSLAELGNDYDVGLANYFKESFVKKGGTVTSATFPRGTTEFGTYITNAKNAGADIIFAPTSITNATQIIDQAAAQGITIPILAGDTWDNNQVAKAATGKNLQIYVSTFYQEGGNPEFDAKFREFINSDPANKKDNGGNDMVAAVSIMGYDAYYVALEAMKKAGSIDPKAINEALWGVTYEGISGSIVFDQVNGDAVRDTAYIKAVNTETGAWDLEAEQTIK